MAGQYSEKVMDHFMHPRNVGEMENPDGIGHVGNPICIASNTLIYTNSKAQRIQDIEEGTRVLSQDGRFHEVSAVFRREYEGKVYSIYVHNLGKTTTTPEHHIFAMKTSGFVYKHKAHKNLKPDWYCAEELQKGDLILYPIPKEEINQDFINFDIEKPKWDFKSRPLPSRIPVNEEFLRLSGYYLAEGYVSTRKCRGVVGFVFWDREIGYLTDVIFIMKKLFGLDPSAIRNVNNSTNLTYYSARLARFFEKLFGKGAANKSIPHWMMFLPSGKQRALICGLWRGDGYINEKGSKYVTISKQLAYQIRQMLLRQKMIFSFLTTKEHGIHKKSHSIYIKEESSLKKLAEIIGAEIRRAPKKKNPFKSWYDDSYYYVPIRRIEAVDFKGKVYNLEVKDSHSYLSPSLTLHNCGDIMEMYIKVKEDVIVDVKFKTFGCGAAIATSSMATEMIKGKTIDEALKLTNQAVAEALHGLPPVKMHCSVLAEEAVKAAIDDYLKKTTGKGLPGFKPHEEPLEEHAY